MDYKKILETISKYLPNPQAIELNKWIDELRKENDNLREEIKTFRHRIADLTSPKTDIAPDLPKCPNCTTSGRPFYMSACSNDEKEISGGTHICSKCSLIMTVK